MKTLTWMFVLSAPALFAETLEERLEVRAAEAAKKGDPAVRAEFAKGIEAVAESGMVEKAKQVGDKAPDFTLKDAKGGEVTLSKLLQQGPVVLTWYRGGWCPYCNIAMAAMQEKLPEFRKHGATLVALTPELPDKTLDTKQKNELEFEVLTDLNHGVAEDYGLVFELTPKVRELYKKFFDLTEFNGADAGDGRLPLAATYVIDGDGVIRWAFLDADYRQRAEPAEIVAALEKLEAAP